MEVKRCNVFCQKNCIEFAASGAASRSGPLRAPPRSTSSPNHLFSPLKAVGRRSLSVISGHINETKKINELKRKKEKELKKAHL